jgi:hypothetical protein
LRCARCCPVRVWCARNRLWQSRAACNEEIRKVIADRISSRMMAPATNAHVPKVPVPKNDSLKTPMPSPYAGFGADPLRCDALPVRYLIAAPGQAAWRWMGRAGRGPLLVRTVLHTLALLGPGSLAPAATVPRVPLPLGNPAGLPPRSAGSRAQLSLLAIIVDIVG